MVSAPTLPGGAAAQIDDEPTANAGPGAEVDTVTLNKMCGLAVDARAACKAQTASASRESARPLRAVLKPASDTLVRARLAAVEACRGAADLAEDLTLAAGWNATLAHPGYVARMRLNPDKTDFSDARMRAGVQRRTRQARVATWARCSAPDGAAGSTSDAHHLGYAARRMLE